MNAAAWQDITQRVAAACSNAGLDLVQPFNVGSYNSTAAEVDRLQGFGRAGALGMLIGNTRQLWPAFTAAFRADATVASSEQPLDTYVVTRLTRLLAEATRESTLLVFAHVTQPRAFPIQRLAESIGFAAISPSRLAVHPVHGPWLGLRAVAVVDVDGPSAEPPALERPCVGCSAPCMAALDRALSLSGTPLVSAAIARHAPEWIAVRDACPVGRASRYGSDQLAYHYAPARWRIVPEPWE